MQVRKDSWAKKRGVAQKIVSVACSLALAIMTVPAISISAFAASASVTEPTVNTAVFTAGSGTEAAPYTSEYTGTAKTFFSTLDLTRYTVSATSATNVGETIVTVALRDTTDKWDVTNGTNANLTYYFKINKATAYISSNTLTYTGGALAGITVKNSEKTEVTSGVTITNGTKINAGPYTAAVTLDTADYYQYSVNGGALTATSTAPVYVDYTIGKLTVNDPTSNRGTAYTGKAQSVFTDHSAADAAYYTYAGNTAGTAAGSYTATATLKDSANTQWKTSTNATISNTLVITKASVTVPTSVTDGVVAYDGAKHSGYTNATSTDLYTVSGATDVSAIGSYSTTVTLVDTNSETWANELNNPTGPRTVNWAITSNDATTVDVAAHITALANTTSYTGSSMTGVESDSAFTLTGDVNATTAGPHTVYATLNTLAYTNKSVTVSNSTGEAKTLLTKSGAASGVTVSITGTVATITWTIAKKSVTYPTSVSKEYTGSDITAYTDGAGYTFTGAYVSTTKAKTVGTYTAYAWLTDKANYQWASGTDGTAIPWTITQKQITAPAAVNDIIYDASAHTPFAATSDYTVGGDVTKTNVGPYTATFTLTDPTNTAWASGFAGSRGWNIVKADVAIPTVSTGFTYDGTAKTAVATGTGYTISGTNSATDAGSYNVTVALKDINNTEWAGGSSTLPISTEWDINAMQVAVPNAATGLVYSGSEQTGVNVSAIASYVNVSTDSENPFLNNVGTNVGSYTATLTLKNPTTGAVNLVWAGSNGSAAPKSITWSIAQGILTAPSVADKTYTGSAIVPLTATDNYKISGDMSETNVGTYSITLTPTELGIANCAAWSDGTTMSAGAIKTVVWKIVAKTIAVPTATSYKYDGTQKTGVAAGSGYTLSGTPVQTAAGSYSAIATLIDTANTTWADGTIAAKTVSWTISAATLAEPTIATPFTYTGGIITAVTDVAGLIVGGTNQASQPGTYAVTLTPGVNYAWADGTSTVKSISWTIAAALPGKVSIEKVSVGTAKLRAVWYKASGVVSKYQIAYRIKGGSYKYTTVASSVSDKLIQKLKSGKTYTVKVRAYNVCGYGAWSTAKTVKVK